MPEGPEIYIMIQQLQRFAGATLQRIQLNKGRYVRHGFQCHLILPIKIRHIRHHGKMIWMELAHDQVIIISLGLTGSLYSKPPPLSTANLEFKTNRGTIYMEDPRNFGTVQCGTMQRLKEKLVRLGPDVMQASISGLRIRDTYEKVVGRTPNKTIAELLLDQRIYAGPGNYIRSEGLYNLHIHPKTKIKHISYPLYRRLILCIRRIMKQIVRGTYQLKIYRQPHAKWITLHHRRIYY